MAITNNHTNLTTTIGIKNKIQSYHSDYTPISTNKRKILQYTTKHFNNKTIIKLPIHIQIIPNYNTISTLIVPIISSPTLTK